VELGWRCRGLVSGDGNGTHQGTEAGLWGATDVQLNLRFHMYHQQTSWEFHAVISDFPPSNPSIYVQCLSNHSVFLEVEELEPQGQA